MNRKSSKKPFFRAPSNRNSWPIEECADVIKEYRLELKLSSSHTFRVVDMESGYKGTYYF